MVELDWRLRYGVTLIGIWFRKNEGVCDLIISIDYYEHELHINIYLLHKHRSDAMTLILAKYTHNNSILPIALIDP